MKLTYSVFPLMALMAATRLYHFGDSACLPDATLAVFFLAGFCFSQPILLLALLSAAASCDYIAIHQLGVSDWCVSPAYLFLIPTYSLLWFAGRFCDGFINTNKQLTLKNSSLSIAIAALATSMAFFISNISFYLFSGKFDDLSLINYSHAVTQYYLPYLSAALLYTVLGFSVIKLRVLFKGVNQSAALQ